VPTNKVKEVIIQLGKPFSSHRCGSHWTVLHATHMCVCTCFCTRLV